MKAPVASVIVPCRNVVDTVEMALAGVLASPLEGIEIIVVDDGSTDGTRTILEVLAARNPRIRVLSSNGRGVSAARNVGLDAAHGEYVFFLDADDEVEPDLYPKVIAAMRRDNAEYCRIAHDRTDPDGGVGVVDHLKRDYRLFSKEEILERFLPCFFGYSFDHVKAWYGGATLGANREMGGVVFGCFLASTIHKNHIRFDESVEIFEDAMFTCEYLLACRRTTCIDEVLYHYKMKRTGSMLSKLAGPAFFENKIRLLAKRKELDVKSGGRLASQYAASCVFSLLEILRATFRTKGCLRKGLGTFFRYGRDPVVKAALRHFPLTMRKPFLAVAVLVCRCLFWR